MWDKNDKLKKIKRILRTDRNVLQYMYEFIITDIKISNLIFFDQFSKPHSILIVNYRLFVKKMLWLVKHLFYLRKENETCFKGGKKDIYT